MKKKHAQTSQTTDSPSKASAPVRQIGGQYQIASQWPILVLALMTYLLSLPIFAPWSFWPLGWVVLVPWIVSVCIAERTRWVYVISYLLGAAFMLTHWRWLYSTTPPGYVAGSLYFAIYFPLAAWPVRHLYRTRQWSVAVVLPIAWVATEILRSRGPLSFPWFLLGHTQIRLLTLVQIADLAGAFGVSFIVAMINGWVVDLLLRPILIWQGGRASAPRIGPVGTVVLVISLGATIIYGRYRLASPPTRPGPEIAVVQGDYPLSVNPAPDAPSWLDKREFYLSKLTEAASQEPDMVVLPETPWSMYLNRELREFVNNQELVGQISEERLKTLIGYAASARREHQIVAEVANKQDVYIVIGGLSMDPMPDGANPELPRYNSAFVYTPGAADSSRYDKIHLVLFGEYVPFRFTPYMRWLYLWLNNITPWGRDGFEYSLMPGTQFRTFTMQERGEGGEAHTFAITICYEDVIPQVFRRFVVSPGGRKRVSFMLNISNDGWFGHGTQQSQHLVNCAFRAVENRVGVARAVNTGISGFVNPDGSWHDLVPSPGGRLAAGGSGIQIAHVTVDPRVSVYSRHGDVFGFACLFLWLAACADSVWRRWGKRRVDKRKGNAQS